VRAAVDARYLGGAVEMVEKVTFVGSSIRLLQLFVKLLAAY